MIISNKHSEKWFCPPICAPLACIVEEKIIILHQFIMKGVLLHSESLMSFRFFFLYNKQRKPTLLLLRIWLKVKTVKKSKLWWSKYLGPSSLFASSQVTLWALVPISICASTTHTVAWTYARALLSLSRFFFLKIKRNKPNLFSTFFLKSKYI